MFIIHGWGKLFGGPEVWEKLGSNMQYLGISFWPQFWGFMGGFGEAFGGLLLAIGLFFRPATFLLLCTMIVATARHIVLEDSFPWLSHSMEAGFLFLSLWFVGSGKYSLDFLLFRKERQRDVSRPNGSENIG